MILKKNDNITLKVDEINMMGNGVAKYNDAAVFVQNAVPGDVADCRIIKCARNYYVARIDRLLEPSPQRMEAACPHFHRCGGCNFQHVSYELEKKVKRDYVCSCLAKEGLSDVTVYDVITTGKTARYRNKAQFPLATDDKGGIIFGFYSPKTHKVCAINDCLIQDARFVPIAKSVINFLHDNKISVYNEETKNGLVRHIYLRSAQKTGQIMLCLVLRSDAFPNESDFCEYMHSIHPEISSINFNINSMDTNVILGRKFRTVYGADRIRDELCERSFDISSASFYQVNRDGAELLYNTAFSMVTKEYDLLIDLYCGIGTISLSSHTEKPIIGVEIVPEAVQDATHNAKLNHIASAEFFCGDAAEAFRLIRNHGAKNPLVIVDPPRKGLSEDLINDLAKNRINNILYISCGADTLARDLRLFRELSYTIGPIQPVDMFSRTGHVESVVCLKRRLDNELHERVN